MLDLMTAIKAQLQGDANLNYVRDTDIYVTEDESLIPSAIKFPAIAIKDGAISNEQKLCNNYLQHAQVRITVYQQILKSEESIMGIHGVLSMVSDVITSLVANKLDIEGMMNIFPIMEEASELFGDEEGMIQRKTIIFEYRRHRTWG